MEQIEPLNDPERDIFALAACAPLQGRDWCYVVPELPSAVAAGALKGYAWLEPGEKLLAVIDRSGGSEPEHGCALTTWRLRWFDQATSAAAETGSFQVSTGATSSAKGVGASLLYEALPEPLRVRWDGVAGLDLGGMGTLALKGISDGTLQVLAGVLANLGQGTRSGSYRSHAPPEAFSRAQRTIHNMRLQEQYGHAQAAERISFHLQVLEATPRVWVVPLIAAICILAFLVMALRGVSPINPSAADLIQWGGNLGAAVALENQPWRLLTSVFLHGGMIHLAFNMWVLLKAGPLVERLFGNIGFAILYLLSGLGGSLASAYAHPLIVSIGASGAIFGVVGGLLGFLVTHRGILPMSVIQPLRSSMLAFVGYNVLFGFAMPGIDNMAHLGGLATGFLAGMVLARPWPPPGPGAGLRRQIPAGALLLAVLVGLGSLVIDRIRQQPAVVGLQADLRQPAEVYNDLIRALRPGISRFDDLGSRFGQFVAQLDQNVQDAPPALEELDRIIAEAESNSLMLGQIQVDDAELTRVAAEIQGAQSQRLAAMRALRTYLETGTEDDLEAYGQQMEQSELSLSRFKRLLRDYQVRHKLRQLGP